MSLIECNLIPMASALTIGTLMFSFYNLLTPANRIRISFIGWKKVWISLGLFFSFACVANLLPYIDKPTIWYLGYPLFWNFFGLFGFFYFLYLCYRVMFKPICYKKGNEKKFYDYIEQHNQENVSAKYFCKDVLQSLDNIFSDYEVDKNGKCKWNEYAQKVMVLLSSKNIVCEFVENNSTLAEKIVQKYADFEGSYINTLLLQRVLLEFTLDKDSLYNRRLLGNYNYEIEMLLKKELVEKYDILSFFDPERERLKSSFALNVYEDVVIAVVSQMTKFRASVQACLVLLNDALMRLDESAILGIRCVFEKILYIIVKDESKLPDNMLRESVKAQYVAFIKNLEEKYVNENFLYGSLEVIWEILEDNKNHGFAKELIDDLLEKIKNNPEYGNVSRIFQIMAKKGIDLH